MPDGAAAEGRSAPSSGADAVRTDRHPLGAARPAPSVEASAIPPSADRIPFDLETIRKLWPQILAKLPATLVWRLTQVEPAAVEEPDVLVITPKSGYNTIEVALGSEILESLGRGIQQLIHRHVTIRFDRPAVGRNSTPETPPTESRRADALMVDPLIQKVVELFEARTVQLDYDEPDATPSA